MTTTRIPRRQEDDDTVEAAEDRRRSLRERTGAPLERVSCHSFAPPLLRGNVEQFIGVAQVAVRWDGRPPSDPPPAVRAAAPCR